ncbi:MAG: hypothetical protein ACSLEY_02040 [Candidatus Saccharimonadales bacterium]
MRRNSLSRFVPLIFIVIVAVLFIAVVVSIGRAVFNNQSASPNSSQETGEGRDALLTVENGRSVRLTVRGPIVAEENFRSYQVIISPSARVMTTYKGYLDSVVQSKDLPNNIRAYEQLVYALDKANMMKGAVPDNDSANDMRGICAAGYVYQYAVLVGSQDIKRLWTSTCSGSKGTLQASVGQLNNLFLAQIPDSADILPFRSSGLGL